MLGVPSKSFVHVSFTCTIHAQKLHAQITSLLMEQRRAILTKMTTTGIKQKIPKEVLNSVTQTRATHTGVGRGFDHKYNPEIANAIKHQQEIGVSMMARGFISKQWVHMIHSSRNPPRVMVKLQWLIWLEFLTHSGRTEMTYITTQPTYTPKKATTNSPKESCGTAKIDTNYSNTKTRTLPTTSTF